MAPTALSHLTNPLATPAQLQKSSSHIDGVPGDLEDSIRYEGAKLMQAAGVLLRLPQELIAEAIIVFSRFWVGADGGSLVVYNAKVRIFGSCSCQCLTVPIGRSLGIIVSSGKALCSSSQPSAAFVRSVISGQGTAWPRCNCFEQIECRELFPLRRIISGRAHSTRENRGTDSANLGLSNTCCFAVHLVHQLPAGSGGVRCP